MSHGKQESRGGGRAANAEWRSTPTPYLGRIERGERNPALVNIGKIAAALGVSVAELCSVLRRRLAFAVRDERRAARGVARARTLRRSSVA